MSVSQSGGRALRGLVATAIVGACVSAPTLPKADTGETCAAIPQAMADGSTVRTSGGAEQGPERRLDGIWLSDGYGYVIEIEGDTLQISETTAVSCIPAMMARRRPGSAPPAFQIEGRSSQLEMLAGSSPNERRVHQAGAASDVVIRRASQRPEVCLKTTPDTPESNFEAFWATFNEQHAFLEERGADWAATYKKYRPQVTSTTSPDDLFRILSEMIAPLHDAHTFLSAGSPGKSFRARRPDPNPLTADDRRRVLEIITSKYIRGELRSWCNGRVEYGRLGDLAGYLRITAFAGYTPNGDYEEGARELARAIDAAAEDCRTLRALIIDVRLNGGGADPYGVAVASRLTDAKYVAFVKRARNDPKDATRFTAPQTTWVIPSTGPRFTGRLIELIGRDTVSAGETFSMALMGRKPPVTRIGEPTQGVYSDVLGRRLPNGWRIGLPNEVFLTEGGRHYEVVGVPPDISAPVFTREDLAAGRDSALEKALEIVRNVK